MSLKFHISRWPKSQKRPIIPVFYLREIVREHLRVVARTMVAVAFGSRLLGRSQATSKMQKVSMDRIVSWIETVLDPVPRYGGGTHSVRVCCVRLSCRIQLSRRSDFRARSSCTRGTIRSSFLSIRILTNRHSQPFRGSTASPFWLRSPRPTA